MFPDLLDDHCFMINVSMCIMKHWTQSRFMMPREMICFRALGITRPAAMGNSVERRPDVRTEPSRLVIIKVIGGT